MLELSQKCERRGVTIRGKKGEIQDLLNVDKMYDAKHSEVENCRNIGI